MRERENERKRERQQERTKIKREREKERKIHPSHDDSSFKSVPVQVPETKKEKKKEETHCIRNVSNTPPTLFSMDSIVE